MGFKDPIRQNFDNFIFLANEKLVFYVNRLLGISDEVQIGFID